DCQKSGNRAGSESIRGSAPRTAASTSAGWRGVHRSKRRRPRSTTPEAPKCQKIGGRATGSKGKMNIITRRSFLGSLALGSIYTNVEQPSALQLQGTEEEKEQTGEILWSIARQHPRSDSAHVDFWRKPLCEVAYADQLPLAIGRGSLMFNR